MDANITSLDEYTPMNDSTCFQLEESIVTVISSKFDGCVALGCVDGVFVGIVLGESDMNDGRNDGVIDGILLGGIVGESVNGTVDGETKVGRVVVGFNEGIIVGCSTVEVIGVLVITSVERIVGFAVEGRFEGDSVGFKEVDAIVGKPVDNVLG